MNEQIKMPVRVRRDWHSAQWGCCDNCNTRAHVIDGICPACYDAEYQAERESAYSAELSRLREALEKTKADQAEMLALVKEMREAHINTLSIARIKWGNLDKDVNAIFEQAEQSIAKADAILGESAK